ASVHPAYDWDTPDEEKSTAKAARRDRLNAAIEAELRWLRSEDDEPAWPPAPEDSPRRPLRRGIRIGGGRVEKEEPVGHERPAEVFYHQSAALWLSVLTKPFVAADRPWLRQFVDAYAQWTYAANGAGLDDGDELSQTSNQWNEAYFAVLANCIA